MDTIGVTPPGDTPITHTVFYRDTLKGSEQAVQVTHLDKNMAALLTGIGTPPSGSSMPYLQKFIYKINDNGIEHF